MATASPARAFMRAAFRATPATFKNTATCQGDRTASVLGQNFRYQYSRRGYADSAGKKGGFSTLYWLLGLGAVGGGGYYYHLNNSKGTTVQPSGPFKRQFEHYEQVYNAVAKAIEEHDQYDDGSYGPILLRLAWHASGT